MNHEQRPFDFLHDEEDGDYNFDDQLFDLLMNLFLLMVVTSFCNVYQILILKNRSTS